MSVKDKNYIGFFRNKKGDISVLVPSGYINSGANTNNSNSNSNKVDMDEFSQSIQALSVVKLLVDSGILKEVVSSVVDEQIEKKLEKTKTEEIPYEKLIEKLCRAISKLK